jgi:large subunit ribosomal protein L29
MAMMKMSEITGLTVQELETKGRELRQECLNLRLQQASGQLERPRPLHEIRRTVARIGTALSMKRKKPAAAPGGSDNRR